MRCYDLRMGVRMVHSKLRGNDIELVNNIWVYSDAKESTESTYKNTPCGQCGKSYTSEGHDGCLGTLPGLMNACCGHGSIEETYIQFLDGVCIRGADAKIIIDILKDYIEVKH